MVKEESTVLSIEGRIDSSESSSALDELVQEGACQRLQKALENEVIEYMERHRDLRDEKGKRLVVRNETISERNIVSGVGRLAINQPRV